MKRWHLDKYFGGMLRNRRRVNKMKPGEVAQVIAGRPGGVVIELAVLALGRGPAFPAVRLIEDEAVFLPLQAGLDRLVLFIGVEVFEE